MIARRPLLGAGWTVALVAMVPRAAVATVGGPRFRPGEGRFRLNRRVERELRGDARLAVERAWSIRFQPQGAGYLVYGRQAEVTIDAPPRLAFLADMERARVEEGMFPLLLDTGGGIMGRSQAGTDDMLGRAVAAVRERLDRHFADPDERASAEQFLTELQRAGDEVLADWPAMLFAPGMLDRVDERPVPLPRGETGRVIVQTRASSDPASGLMQRFERRIETRLGDSARSGLERFTLAPE